jgi:hypothetical protein
MNIKIIKLMIFAVFCVSIFSFSKPTLALKSPTSVQFGGRIVTTRISPVICTAQYGPVAIIPATGSKSPGLFNVIASTETLNPGGQILGYYDQTPDMKTCFIQAGPYKIPVPTYKIKTGKLKTSKY